MMISRQPIQITIYPLRGQNLGNPPDGERIHERMMEGERERWPVMKVTAQGGRVQPKISAAGVERDSGAA